MDSHQLNQLTQTVTRVSSGVTTAINNTVLVGKDLDEIKQQIKTLKEDLNQILKNQKVIHNNIEYIVSILEK